MGATRVVFLGNDDWSVASLEAIADSDLDVTLVITKGPRPAGRGSKLRRTAIAEAAEARGMPLAEVDGVSGPAGLKLLDEAAPDVLAVVAYGEILTPQVLDRPRLGAVNLHFSLLPRWRGASPVRRALLERDATTGVTTMLIDEGLDSGPILGQIEVPIGPEEDAGSLGAALATLGASLLVSTLKGWAGGQIQARDQDDELATSTGKFGPSDFRIDWSAGAEDVVARVRASSPKPGASTAFRGEVLKVFRASAVEGGGGPPGLITASPAGPVVSAGAGAVLLEAIASSGRKRMSGADFARGARLAPGEQVS